MKPSSLRVFGAIGMLALLTTCATTTTGGGFTFKQDVELSSHTLQPVSVWEEPVAFKIKKAPEVIDAAISQYGNEYSLALIVENGTSKEKAKELGTEFVRLAKTLSPDQKPDKDLGPGIYDYLVGIFLSDGTMLAMGSKKRMTSTIKWGE